jgi:uncharacterized protein YbcI
MPGIRTEQASEGKLATAISNMVVQALRHYTGRGPTRSRTYIHDQLISVVLQGTLTRAERRLVADGKPISCSTPARPSRGSCERTSSPVSRRSPAAE